MKRSRKRLTKADLHRAEVYIERLRKRADKQGDSMTEWHLNSAGVNVSDAIKYVNKGSAIRPRTERSPLTPLINPNQKVFHQ